MFGTVFSNVIVKDRCPRCNGFLIADAYDSELTCGLCARHFTPKEIQEYKFLAAISRPLPVGSGCGKAK